MKAVVLLSGGVDSTTLAYVLKSRGVDLTLLSIFYGQRHAKEIDAAETIARTLESRLHVIDLSSVGHLLSSSLTSPDTDVPEGHYEAESMKSTVVPNRNAIFLSIAFGIAASIEARIVGTAVHAGDHAIYPDCRPEFIKSFDEMEAFSLQGVCKKIGLYTPFIDLTKAAIVRGGLVLKVPYELTWSCYKGGDRACGKCGTCVERLEAFAANNVQDPVEYE